MRRAGRPPRAAQRSAELRPRRCAAQIEPDFYPKNKLLAAQAFAKLGRKDEAKEWLAACLRSPAKTPEDEETLKEAAKLKI